MRHSQDEVGKNSGSGWKGTIALGLGALGVVYGDIGTSPLYALKEIFLGESGLPVNQENVMGVVSMVFWILTIIITFKYVILVLRADHENEGGVFALYARLKSIKKINKRWPLLLLIFSAGLLLGDGLITPSISIISAVEGLAVAAPSMERIVLPATILILTGLFSIQSKGTSLIGKLFGPVMLVWFVVLAIMGITNILKTPWILTAVSPTYALNFLTSTSFHELLIVLGFIVLVVTGGEAMYADMGHFGRDPIRLSWLVIAYPALILNYFGQGAYLLSGNEIVGGSVFYSMIPNWGLYPLIMLATGATIIASQALITGSYSLISQASALELLPPIPTKHTHRDHMGQIYISLVNKLLYLGCIVIILSFRTSSNLASAYGLAESGVMIITTITVAIIAKNEWGWKWWQVVPVFLGLMMIDVSFLAANALKFFDGGFVPTIIGVCLMAIMASWRWGVDRLNSKIKGLSKQTVGELYLVRRKSNLFTSKTAIVITDAAIRSMEDESPPINNVYMSNYEILPEHLVYLTVITHQEATTKERRIEVYHLDSSPENGTIASVVLNYGFMEKINVYKCLKKVQKLYPEIIHQNRNSWMFHIIHPRLYKSNKLVSLKRRLEYTIFSLIWRNSMSTEDFVGIDHRQNISTEQVAISLV